MHNFATSRRRGATQELRGAPISGQIRDARSQRTGGKLGVPQRPWMGKFG
jgi:hypothetical protein